MSHPTEHRREAADDTRADIHTPTPEDPRADIYGKEPTFWDKHAKTRGGQVGALALATTLVLGTGVGVWLNKGQNTSEQPAPQPTIDAPATPGEVITPEPKTEVTATPTPEVSPTDIPEPTDIERPYWYNKEDIMKRPDLPSELKKYQTMPIDEFQGLPKSEQLLYGSWLNSYRKPFMEWYSTVSGNPANNPVTLTPESSGEDIFSELGYISRMAHYATIGTPEPQESGRCGVMDQDAVFKILSAHSTLDGYEGIMSQAQQYIDGSNGEATCPSALAFFNRFDLDANGKILIQKVEKSEVEIDGITSTKATISYTLEKEDGLQKRIFESYIVPAVGYDGETAYNLLSKQSTRAED